MYAGRNAEDTEDDLVFVAMNMFWESREQYLPIPPDGKWWNLFVATSDAAQFVKEEGKLILPGRSMMVLYAK